MEKTKVSLKNIYKILMNNDFPIYSESVINAKDRKGHTVLRFWQHRLIEEFKELPYGRMIWRNDGKRNRYTSHLCNRSDELKCYNEYAKELLSQINQESVINQIENFMMFLADKEYKYDVFIRRMESFWEIAKKEDELFANAVTDTFRKYTKKACHVDMNFHAGWLLTMFTLFAATGEAMQMVAWELEKEEYSLSCLWELYIRKQEKRTDNVVFLTKNENIMLSNKLPKHSFFGREVEVFELQEMATNNQKVAISGIGGIGKTELLKQLLSRCVEMKLVDFIALVPFKGNIEESFAHAFGGNSKETLEEKFHALMNVIRNKINDGKKVLILIDNMDVPTESDEAWEELLTLSCSILVTTRQSKLNGCDTYQVLSPSIATSALIFRDHYGRLSDVQDKVVLQQLLKNEALCHPLTLRLMARAAANKNWSVVTLKNQLEQKNIELSWTEDNRTIRLRQIYSQLYSISKVPVNCGKFIELFTVLPPGFFGKEILGETLPENIDMLVQYGWLNEEESGYSMHPLVASCLRKRNISEEKMCELFTGLRRRLTERRVAEAFVFATGYLKGRVSKEYILTVQKAMAILEVSKTTKIQYQELLESLMKRCEEMDVAVEIGYWKLRGYWDNTEGEPEWKLFLKQKENLVVDEEEFIDFCIEVGASLVLKGKLEYAEPMLCEVLQRNATVNKKAEVYYSLSVCKNVKSDYQGMMEMGEKAAQFVESHPECDEEYVFQNLGLLCGCYLQFGKKEEAKNILDKMQLIYKDSLRMAHKIQYQDLQGVYQMQYGDLKIALEHVERCMELTKEYEGEGYNYLFVMNKSSIILQRMEEFEKSEERYLYLISKSEELKIDNLLLSLKNNISVLYLEMKKPEKALKYLQDIKEKVQQNGGLTLGEYYRNSARAYGQLGEIEKEYEFLLKGSPVLDRIYGENHPRSVASRERLEELKEIRRS